jgi:hypothetical protein
LLLERRRNSQTNDRDRLGVDQVGQKLARSDDGQLIDVGDVTLR